MRVIVWIMLACILVSTVSAASFGLYVDDSSPPQDTILATNVMTQAEAKTSALPASGYDHLFSQYAAPDELMLVISHGSVWLVAQPGADLGAEMALVQTLQAEHVDYNLTKTVPPILTGSGSVHANDTTETAPAGGSGSNDSTGSPARTETGSNGTSPSTHGSDGSNGAENATSNSSCAGTVCPVTGGNATDAPAPVHRSLIARILEALFGWIRR